VTLNDNMNHINCNFSYSS